MVSMASTFGKQIPGFMALGMMGHAAGMAKKSFDWDSKKEKDKGNLIKGFVPIMVGVPMISATAGMVNIIP